MRSLDDIAGDYDRAELTVVWFQEQASGRHQLLFAVAEMCPIEQEPSDAIESTRDGRLYSQVRSGLSEGRTLYATRIFCKDPREAIAFFRGLGGRRITVPAPRPLRDETAMPEAIVLEAAESLSEEPPGECPVVVTPEGGISAGLPSRPCAMRLVSRFDVRGRTQAMLGPAELRKVSVFSADILGVDLEKYREHLGAIHLCFSNPIWRRFSERLTADNRELIFQSYLRRGRTVDGCVVEFVDERETGTGFHVRHVLKSATDFVSMPTRPRKLRTLLFDPSGDCLEDQAAAFIDRVDIQMDLMSAPRRAQLRRANGTVDEQLVHTYSPHESGPADRASKSPAQMFDQARRRRLMEDLSGTDDFHYFPGGDASYDRARDVVRKLLGTARHRCLLCDVFLSASDAAEFVPFVKRVRLPVRLLGSAWFLRQKDVDRGPRQGDELKRCVDAIRANDASIDVQCKVLAGRSSAPVHDRFMMIDDDVYLLGSSLNEFGRRATTLFRVPDPDSIRAELEKWWDGRGGLSTPLEEWLSGQPEDTRS